MMSESLSEVATVGRGLDNSLVIGDQSVSQHHAMLSKIGGRYWLKDLDSSNGTYVNGRRITEATVVAGDLVNFGQVQREFDGQTFCILTVGDSLGTENRRNKAKVQPLRLMLGVSVFFAIVLLVVVRTRGGGLSTNQVARATVKIVMKDSSGENCWSGSGALILDGKYVVTNAHVAALSAEDGPEYSDCKVLSIGLSDSSGLNPSDYVAAAVATIDRERDLALVKLNTPINSDTRKSLSIRTGDVGLEMQIRIFGYPGIGGDSLTTSSGIISGLDHAGKFSYFKVSADISSGNSGGPVVDNKGRLIGIATAISRQEIDCSSGSTCYSEGNGLGLVRPISLLQSLLNKIDDN